MTDQLSGPAPATSADQDPSSRHLRILFVTPECTPLAKVGGLADVVTALSKALVRLGHDVRIVMPLYRCVDRAAHGVVADGSACLHFGGGAERWIGVHSARLSGNIPVWLVDYGEYFDRPGIYGDSSGEYLDSAYRFSLLSKAALQLCKDRGFIPHVMHLHDWPCAVTAVLLKTWDRILSPLAECASVLTIHNIGHQGKFAADAFGFLGVGPELFASDTFEDYGQLNLLKAGVRFADLITTVSPTHLSEIRSAEGGHGLAPYLARRDADLAGILNGVDYDEWNPETDLHLPARYSAQELTGKAICKQVLQDYFGLPTGSHLPVVGLVTRLALQKGIDLLCETLPGLLERHPLQLVLLGSGEPVYEDFFRWLQHRFPSQVGCYLGYNEKLAHLIEGGADFFLMPSLYEPCGLNQMYSMRYGTLPVVRATGGLKDTVAPFDPRSGQGTGFVFQEARSSALAAALQEALITYLHHPAQLEAMRQQAMAADFSWARSAQEYLLVYQRARLRRQSWQ